MLRYGEVFGKAKYRRNLQIDFIRLINSGDYSSAERVLESIESTVPAHGKAARRIEVLLLGYLTLIEEQLGLVEGAGSVLEEICSTDGLPVRRDVDSGES